MKWFKRKNKTKGLNFNNMDEKMLSDWKEWRTPPKGIDLQYRCKLHNLLDRVSVAIDKTTDPVKINKLSTMWYMLYRDVSDGY